MARRASVVLGVMMIAAGCRRQADSIASVGSASSQAVKVNAPATSATAPESSIVQADGFSHYSDPPRADVGLSVDQAYAAIPHRRTAWTESETSVPASERVYLKTIFGVVDEAIAMRVAGLQNFSQQRFDTVDVDGQLDQLISFTRSMPVPTRLGVYHGQVLAALAADRQFFAEWKAQGAAFPYAQRIAANGDVQAASAAARAAYSELMSKYPGESQANKDAFFDYHCALDFL